MTRAELIDHIEWSLRRGDQTVLLPAADLRRELGAQASQGTTIISEFGATVCPESLSDCARCKGCQK